MMKQFASASAVRLRGLAPHPGTDAEDAGEDEEDRQNQEDEQERPPDAGAGGGGAAGAQGVSKHRNDEEQKPETQKQAHNRLLSSVTRPSRAARHLPRERYPVKPWTKRPGDRSDAGNRGEVMQSSCRRGGEWRS